MGAIEDEIVFSVGRDDDGVALNAFGLHTLPQSGQASGIVGFVQDQTRSRDDSEVVESGDQLEIVSGASTRRG